MKRTSEIDKPSTALLFHVVFFLSVYGAIAGGDRSLGCALLWPANAIAVTTFLLVKRAQWRLHLPGLFGSLLLANLLNRVAPAAAFGFAIANIAEITAATVVLRHARFVDHGFRRLTSTLLYIAIGGVSAPLLSGLIGGATVSVVLGKAFMPALMGWFAADALGLLVVAPACIAFLSPCVLSSGNTSSTKSRFAIVEQFVTIALFLLLVAWVLSKPIGEDPFGLRRLHAVVLGTIWLAVRHSSPVTMLANLLVAVGALLSARMWLGPFVFENTSTAWSIVDAQLFVVVLTVSVLLVHALVQERRDAMQDALVASLLAEERNLLLAESNGALADAVSEAQRANLVKSEFLANMSHEIRTPLTAIIGYTELVQHSLGERTSEDILQCLLTIRRNGDHLLQVINDILDISKIEAGQFELARDACSVCDVLYEVVRLLRVRADEKGIQLRLSIQGLLPASLETDSLRLKQVLINLIGNAIKFTSQGTVDVLVQACPLDSPTRIEFRVTDSGVGMTAEQLSRLFRPFSQADASTSRRFGGSGLGLAISQRISELLGGSISVTSDFGVGSSFTLQLPLTTRDATCWIRPETPIAPTVAASTSTVVLPGGCHVLLAEDGRDNQRLIGRILEAAGAKVTIVDDGVAACEALASDSPDSPDVILMDMQMPRLSGYEATRRLRERGITTPIIAITAHAMSGDREKCLLAGCDDYLTKPINRDELLTALKNHLLRGHSAAERSA
jgi:signal transduction histidine kinase/CheY-like chemotaxis protein